MYKVIKDFADIQDGRHPYKVGDIFPHEGLTVTEERIKELSTDKNRRGIPLIESVPETRDNTPKINSTDKAEEIPSKDVKQQNGAKSKAKKRVKKNAD